MSTDNPKDELRYVDASTALGGADAVEKTTYVATAHGAEPGDAPSQNERVTAQIASRGSGPFIWVAVALGAVVLLAFGAALFR